MAELLLELLSEEIPARMQSRAAGDLKRLLADGFKAAGLSYGRLDAFAGPRRLTVVVDDLPTAQPDVTDERKGPGVGAPEKAIEGFLKANGLASVDEAEVRELPKGQFYFAVIERKGRPAADVLKDVIEAAFAALPWPKSMRWGSGDTRWVRPLHGILCLFDGAVVPVSYAGVSAGNETLGHRFLAPAGFAVSGFDDYAQKLEAAKVVIDQDRRRALIADGIAALAQAEGLSIPDDSGLLDEVTGLVEWPVPLLGTIDDAFMDVPPEVLTSAMRKHQKYFALETGTGAFSNRYALVANIETPDGGKAIVAGNERVLRARLSDAKFFWDQDRQEKLASRVDKLSERVFQADLGTVRDKVERLEALSASLAEKLGNADGADVRRAAHLSKADLSTGMVAEFPDLQGLMGRYYAEQDKESGAVCDAIAEHYSPLGPSDDCPSAPVSVCVALGDKIDTLVGFFGIDQKPTGSKDPYALRRAALGVIRLILENNLRLPLADVLATAFSGYGTVLKADKDTVVSDLLTFFADRLKVYLKDRGVRHDLIAAVFAVGGEDDLVRLMARVDALAKFLGSDDGSNLLTAYKRAANIVRIEEKKEKASFTGEFDAAVLEKGDAQSLASSLGGIEADVKAALSEEDFSGAMSALAALRQPLDVFFDKVTVNADDAKVRSANLNLLARIGQSMDQVADFSNIEG
ncbi:MAG: glycine--tRNA ligase subunit beta [Rhodospirillaceae bacterium]|jgi:glycyl-tRNA synthetase beta chain|nr:glycine--tRNA ligase subunit beta [Rhodospirillaceae bacterium]MBT5566718.1 glycine--tRNA ligase subunit beta [Rhodospirillaceae bacterium]MBT6090769.1 glycine--tRNA ligase subunit beta [Rhodospirillaceae bacterium]MBT6959742.1 glycine--tRNA ligase subunit beta [Rhodospirillaceae bacterium]MBT7451148.1 glycine--tRNA ligase subunit beta [Rhodospirillaceae bacterium]